MKVTYVLTTLCCLHEPITSGGKPANTKFEQIVHNITSDKFFIDIVLLLKYS